MRYKSKVLAKRPNAALIRTPGAHGMVWHVVMDGDTALDAFGHQNRGSNGAWRDAYYFLVRQERDAKTVAVDDVEGVQ